MLHTKREVAIMVGVWVLVIITSIALSLAPMGSVRIAHAQECDDAELTEDYVVASLIQSDKDDVEDGWDDEDEDDWEDDDDSDWDDEDDDSGWDDEDDDSDWDEDDDDSDWEDDEEEDDEDWDDEEDDWDEDSDDSDWDDEDEDDEDSDWDDEDYDSEAGDSDFDGAYPTGADVGYAVSSKAASVPAPTAQTQTASRVASTSHAEVQQTTRTSQSTAYPQSNTLAKTSDVTSWSGAIGLVVLAGLSIVAAKRCRA